MNFLPIHWSKNLFLKPIQKNCKLTNQNVLFSFHFVQNKCESNANNEQQYWKKKNNQTHTQSVELYPIHFVLDPIKHISPGLRHKAAFRKCRLQNVCKQCLAYNSLPSLSLSLFVSLSVFDYAPGDYGMDAVISNIHVSIILLCFPQNQLVKMLAEMTTTTTMTNFNLFCFQLPATKKVLREGEREKMDVCLGWLFFSHSISIRLVIFSCLFYKYL